jgi:ATP-binding cassette subfamily B protein/subfamily B ATP-binding cassette protein MsbA
MADLIRVLSYLRPHRRAFSLALVQVLLVTGLELLKPWPLKLVLDNVVPRRPAGWSVLAGMDAGALLLLAAVALVAVHAALGALNVANNFTTIRIGQGMVDDLRGQLYDRLQRMSLQVHARSAVGDLIYRVTADAFAIQTLAMNGIFPVVASLLLLGGMFAVMLQLSWQLTLVALAVCPLLLATVTALNRRISALASEARQRESAVYAHVQRGMSGIRVIQAFTMEDQEQRAFLSSSRASLQANLRLYTVQTVYAALVSLVLALGVALVLWLGARRVWGAQLTVGELIVFVSYLGSLYGPLNSILQTYGMVVGARAGVRRVFEILDRNPPVPDGTRVPSQVRGQVRLERVSFSYDGERLALRDVSFEAQAGQVVAIVGHTGAGKSTLVSLLPRFIEATSGRVEVDGLDVRDWRLATLRRAMAMVLQPPMVFPLTVAENISYGSTATSLEIERVARLARAHDFITRLPRGYETVIGEQGATLSEGERQRLTIARALLRNAPILILDEPTSSVDVETEALILEGVRALMHGRTTLVIAHRLATVRDADVILVLCDGEIVERGGYRELIARDGAFARLHTTTFGLDQGPGARATQGRDAGVLRGAGGTPRSEPH